MKNLCLLIFFVILKGFCYSQFTYPIDMEGTYGAGELFGGFGGATATVVANPDQTGSNTSPNVLEIIKGPPEPWAGMEFVYAVPVPAGSFGATGSTPYVCFDYYTDAPVGSTMSLKFEFNTNCCAPLLNENTAVSGEWSQVCYTPPALFEGRNKPVIIFRDGQPGDGGADFTLYVDNVDLYATPPVTTPTQNELTLPITFEDGSVVTNDFGDIGGGYLNGNGFDGGLASVESNTNLTGNPSATVGQIIRYDTPSAGSFINLTGDLDFSVDPTICMKVFTAAPTGTDVILKMEDPDGGQPNIFVGAVTTVSGAWETLCFDFTGVPTAYNRMTFLFDFNEQPDGSTTSTFRFDDIEQLSAPPTGISLPIDFEGDVVTADFANFDGGVGSVVSNPSPTGINTSPLVGRIVRSSQNFSGSRIVLAQNLNFSTETIISMKVYTTQPIGTRIIFKLEGAISTAEDEFFTTTTGEWESFDFDFTGTSTTLNELVFLFDANNSSPGSIFYFDDIEQRAPNEVALPLDFEGGVVVPNDLGGIGTGFSGANGVDEGAATIISNPQIGGENTSTTVGQIVRHSGSTSAGAFVNLVTNLNFDAYPIICMNVFTDAPVGTNVTLRIEDTDTGAPDIDAVAVTTVSGEWEPLCFVYQLAPDSYDRLTFLFDFGNVGDGTNESTFFFDDVEQFITPPFFDFTTGSQFFCPPNSLTLTFPGSGTYIWYDNPSATDQVGTGPTFTTPILNGTTAYYVRNTATSPLPQTAFGPALRGGSTLGNSLTTSTFFTSNIDNGLFHSVDIVLHLPTGAPDGGACTYRVDLFNNIQGTSRTIQQEINPAIENGQHTYTFASPLPIFLGDQLEMRVTSVTGVPCYCHSSSLGDNNLFLPFPSFYDEELTFTGHTANGVASNNMAGLNFTISGSIVDPTIYQVNAIADCANPLPIELLDFSVREDNGDALLHWSTATELNNDRFLLMRTLAGIRFETVGTVSGAGNSSTVLHYSFRDRNPLKGLSYYMLKQVDFDGKESDSELVAFTNDGTSRFQLFPNPTSENLTLTLNEGFDNIEVRIYDLTGRLINQHEFGASDNLSFELTGNPGTYFVEVLVDEQRRETFNVMKL